MGQTHLRLLTKRILVGLDSVETELLGRKALSFAIEAERLGWKPEQQTQVCWRCAGSVGEYETDGNGCASCRGNKLAWDRAIRLGHYEGIIGSAVRDLKFRRWVKTGHQVGAALGVEIRDRLEAMQVLPSQALIVPIPMTRRRRISRGVDHTHVLACGIRKSVDVKICRMLRARNRAEQVGLSATDRAKNMRGAFYVPEAMSRRSRVGAGVDGVFLSGIRVVMVLDDVRTTGSTLKAGCQEIRKLVSGKLGGGFGGAEVEIWAVCVGFAGNERKAVRDGEGNWGVEAKRMRN